MKKIFNIKAVLLALLTVSLFSSCLKDDTRYIPFQNDGPVVDFAIVPFGGALQTATLSSAATTNSLNALISLAGQHDYSTPTSVTLIVDQAAMTATYGSTYTLLPASVYTVSSLSTSGNPGIQQRIENNQPIVGTPLALPSASEAMISFVINTPAYQALVTANPGVTYMLPLTISSVSGNGAVIDQYHTVYFKIAIK